MQDLIRAQPGVKSRARPPVTTHCRRELMHAALRTILDDDFLEAYQHGNLLTCADGVRRRIFPRIFTYPTDYCEKLVLCLVLHYVVAYIAYKEYSLQQ